MLVTILQYTGQSLTTIQSKMSILLRLENPAILESTSTSAMSRSLPGVGKMLWYGSNQQHSHTALRRELSATFRLE